MKLLLSWSGGKDSAWLLHTLRRRSDLSLAGLLTTVEEASGRVAGHLVRGELLDLQAEAVGLPVTRVPLPYPCPNRVFEERLGRALQQAAAEGVEAVAYGDLYLEDLRHYREDVTRETGLKSIFPLWHRPTRELAREMIAGGLRARLVCVDPVQVPAGILGRDLDARLLADLPGEVDPCAENGEFHTFAHDGPMFRRQVPFTQGERSERDGLRYLDLLPVRE